VNTTEATALPHQYIDRRTGKVVTEKLLGDRLVGLLYSTLRECAPALFRLATSRWASGALAAVNFNGPLNRVLRNGPGYAAKLGVDLHECVKPASHCDTPRRIFERQIRYWECRPMDDDPAVVVSPADARALVGTLASSPALPVKEKFFTFDELLGEPGRVWADALRGGYYALFRLTPDKYHYNHLPAAGVVVDYYGVGGQYHSCNPAAVIQELTPHSKNRRFVTILDADVKGGAGVGLVAMVEVVALMIGAVAQRYSEVRYEEPEENLKGVFLGKGCLKSRFLPGSSTVILLFQKGRIVFEADLVANQRRGGVASRFSQGFRELLVETDLAVRSSLARKKRCGGAAAPGGSRWTPIRQTCCFWPRSP